MAAVLAPLLVPALGATGATIAANVAIYAATTAASYFLQQALQPEQKDPGIRGEVAIGEDVPQSFIVGTYATAGSFVYANAYGGVNRTPNAYLVQVFCLSDLPVTGFASHMWVNNKRCNIDTGTTTSRGFPVPAFDRGGRSHMWVKFLDGTQTSADAYLIDKFGAHATHPWQSDMIGRGRALAIVTTRYDREQFSAFPTFLFVVDGIKVYDPRFDTTNGGSGSQRYGTASTYAWRDNAKVIAYNIARGIYYGSEWVYGGQNWPAWRLDNGSWFAAMNKCDEAISLAAGGTEAAFEIGAEIRVNEKPVDVLDRIDAACLGRSAETGGIYKTYCGAGGASIFSLTDDDIVASEPQSAGLFPGHENWTNTIRASYVRPGNMWQTKALNARTDSAFVTADGGQTLEKSVVFDYVTRGTQAQRVAKVMLRQGRRFISHVVAAPPWARKVEQFDVIAWTSVKFGYTAKKFIVGEVNRSRNGVVIWTLTEEDPTDVAWSTADEEAETDAVTGDLDAATDTIAITVTAVSLRDNAGNSKRPALKVNWTIDDDVVDVVGVRFQVRDATTLEIVRRTRSDDWDDGEVIISAASILRGQNYQVRAQWIPKSDRPTAWSAWTSSTAVPNVGEAAIIDPDSVGTTELKIDSVVAAASASGDKSFSSTGGTMTNSNSSTTTTLASKTINNPNPSPVTIQFDFFASSFISTGVAQNPQGKVATTVTLTRVWSSSPVRTKKLASFTANATISGDKLNASAARSGTFTFIDADPPQGQAQYLIEETRETSRTLDAGGGATLRSKSSGSIALVWLKR